MGHTLMRWYWKECLLGEMLHHNYDTRENLKILENTTTGFKWLHHILRDLKYQDFTKSDVGLMLTKSKYAHELYWLLKNRNNYRGVTVNHLIQIAEYADSINKITYMLSNNENNLLLRMILCDSSLPESGYDLTDFVQNHYMDSYNIAKFMRCFSATVHTLDNLSVVEHYISNNRENDDISNKIDILSSKNKSREILVNLATAICIAINQSIKIPVLFFPWVLALLNPNPEYTYFEIISVILISHEKIDEHYRAMRKVIISQGSDEFNRFFRNHDVIVQNQYSDYENLPQQSENHVSALDRG